ncbi:hypothetical protein BH11PLA2_BH11PLA2_50310 [soil metagenome]
MLSSTASAADNQLRRARTELEKALRGGTDTRAETLMSRYPALAADSDSALELVYTEFVIRTELGQNPKQAEWFERFPQLKTDLEQVFQVDQELRKEEASRVSRSGTATFPRLRSSTLGVPHVPGYEVQQELGRGGMGVVYQAMQSGLNRTVALKVILSGLHAGERDRARFRREAEAAARLDHPNIVRIYDVGEAEGRPYCAMELVEGGSLADKLTGTPWAFRAAAEFVALLAGAVQHAHERGIVHRDLKPANILLPSPLGGEGLKIADFGLAKFLVDSEAGGGPTRTGDLVGTPAYMAPEQALARIGEIGPATDIWALGVTLYEMLTGHLPFRGESTAETLDQVRSNDAVPPKKHRPNLPADLQTICLKCLHKSPAGRYSSAAALADDLERWLRGDAILARPTSTWEKATRWCKRNPRVAVLTMVIAGLCISTIVFGIMTYLRQVELSGQSQVLAQQEQLARQRAEADSVAKAALALESQRRLTQIRVTDGLRYLNDGDLTGGAVILAAAMETDPDAANDETHRIRLATTFRATPTLVRYAPATGRLNAESNFSADGSRYFTTEVPGERTIRDSHTGAALPRSVPMPSEQVRYERLNRDGKVFVNVVGAHVEATDVTTGERLTLPLDAQYAPLPWPYTPNGSHFVQARQGTVTVTYKAAINISAIHITAANGRQNIPPLMVPNQKSFRGYAVSHDSKRLATGDQNGIIAIWNIATGKRTGQEFTLDGVVQSVDWSPDDRTIIACNATGIARIWDVGTAREVTTFQHGSALEEVAFSPDGRRVMTFCSKDYTVRVWDALTGSPVGHQIKLPSAVHRVSFSPDSREFITAANDGTLRTWDVGTGEPTTPPLYSAFKGTLSSDGHRLTTASVAGTIRIWDRSATEPLSYIPHESRTHFLNDPRHLVCVSATQVDVFDTTTGKSRHVCSLPSALRPQTTLLPDGRIQIIRESQSKGALRIWNPATQAFDGVPVEFDPRGRGETFLRGGRHAVWETDGVIRIRDAATGTEISTIPLKEPTWGLEASPDGKRLLSKNTRLRIWNLETNTQIALLSDVVPVRESTWSTDGQCVVAITKQGQFVQYDGSSGQPKRDGFPLDKWVARLTLAPDGRYIATLSPTERSVQVWDLTTGQRVGLPLPHRTDVTAILFSPDSRFLATGTVNGIVMVWDVATGLAITPPLGRGSHVSELQYSHDGRKLLARNFDGRTWLWDLTPDPRSMETIASQARLLANRKLDVRGVLTPLTPQEELTSWQSFTPGP